MDCASNKGYSCANSPLRDPLKTVLQLQSLLMLAIVVTDTFAVSCYPKVYVHILSGTRHAPRVHPLQSFRSILPQQEPTEARSINQSPDTTRE